MTNLKACAELLQALHNQFLITGDNYYVTTANKFTEGIRASQLAVVSSQSHQSILSIPPALTAHSTTQSIDDKISTTSVAVMNSVTSTPPTELHVPSVSGEQDSSVDPRFSSGNELIDKAGDAAQDHSDTDLTTETNHSFNGPFDNIGDLTHLQSDIARTEASIEAVQDPAVKVSETFALSVLLLKRFMCFGDLTDLERAIEGTEAAIAVAPEGSLVRTYMLNIVTISLQHRFTRLGNIADIDRAILFGEEFVAISEGSNDRSIAMGNLGSSYGTRFARLGNIEDLDKAIQYCEAVVGPVGDKVPRDVGLLLNMSTSYAMRFNRLGNVSDIDKAIEITEEAIAVASSSFPGGEYPPNNLAAYYYGRFEQFGGLDDLQRSIRACEADEAATPANHPDRPILLTNIQQAFQSMYARSNALEDLEKATRAGEDALAITPLGHPSRGPRFYNLAVMHSERYNRSRLPDDLDRAIHADEEALALIPGDDSHRVIILDHLGTLLSTRSNLVLGNSDQARAKQVLEEAVDATPLDDRARANRLMNLAAVLGPSPYKVRASQLQVVLLARRAEMEAEKCIILSDGTSNRTDQLKELDYCLNWYQVLHDNITTTSNDPGADDELHYIDDLMNSRCRLPEILAEMKTDVSLPGNSSLPDRYSLSHVDRSLDLLLAAWHSQMSPPRLRIGAACSAIELLIFASRWDEVNVLLQDALQILPQIAPQFLGRADQEYQLSGLTTMASDAVAVALHVGETPSHCLGLLELGRGVIMGLAINCRSDVSDLQVKYPDTCSKFNQLRIEIDQPLACQYTDESTYEGRRRRRVQALQEIDEILTSIRLFPGFEGFQLAPRPNDLTALAIAGPIVILNTTKLRSDAIIVTGVIKSVALPKMVYFDVIKQMAELPRLVRGKRSTWVARNKQMAKILLWLWEVAVEPVLEELGLTTVTSRIWWIGVGPLATAPFHAAGDHSRGSTRNTISRVISSYIPTIKALMYATEKKLELNREDTRLLLVTMPTTPSVPAVPALSAVQSMPLTNSNPPAGRPFPSAGSPAKSWKPLQNVAMEANEIIKAVNGTFTTRLNTPTTAQVLEQLPTHNVIHFACHGVSDRNNPSNSHLILNGNHSEPGKLTVGAMANMNIHNAQVAYLSACCTADNPSSELADESIHIASGFQLAGFSHVLATLWESQDEACRIVAAEFYRRLFSGENEGLGHQAVSTAFHHAVLKLRSDCLAQPVKWAAFIHTGA